MLHILTLTIPVYLLIGLGHVAVKAGMFNAADMRVLGRFVVGFCLPGLLFNALSQRDLAEVLQPRYLAGYALGSLLMLLGGAAFLHRVRGKPMDLAALQGLGMGQSNTGFFGFALAAPLLGEPASVALALTLMVENLVMLPLGLALADAGASGQRGSQSFRPAFRRSLLGLLRNPMILAILAGCGFALLGLRLPEPVARTVQLVASASSPVALFVIGGTLAGFSLKGIWRDVLAVGSAKLVLHPLAVAGMMWLFGPVDPLLFSAAVLFAASPMMSIFPVLAQKYGQEGLCAATLLATTLMSFVSINAVLWVLQHPWPWGA